jgi:hypothetical protein
MYAISKYFLPAACFLLIAVFFMLLPDLRVCKLEGGNRRFQRMDALLMSGITLIYAVVAFTGLGNTESPQSFVNLEGQTASIKPDLSDGTVSTLMLFTGVGIGSYSIDYTTDGNDSYHLADFEQSHAEVLKWQPISLDYEITGGTILIRGSGNIWLGEVVPLTEDGRVVRASSDRPELTDEQSLCPDRQTFMNSSYFDEIYHARTAWEHLNGVYPYEITHPPLGKIIIGLGIRLFGMTPFGWRFSGTLFGVLMLPILYYFAKKLFGGHLVPAACAVLMATDFMHFVQTRIATIDTYAVFFILLMYLFMYLFITEERLWALALCGISFGLGAASKWTCFYAGAGLAVIWLLWVIHGFRTKTLDLKGFVKNALFCVLFFVVIPCVIYYLSYYPYGAAEGKTKLFSRDYLNIVLSNQQYMFNYHSRLSATHPYSSTWYQWLLDIRPILYYLDYLPDGRHVSFGAFVNPVLCWGGLLALFVLGFLAIKRRDLPSAYILLGYLAQLLPWVLVQRLIFAYHYFPCTIFLVLALGRCFDVMLRNVRHGRAYVVGFAALSFSVFVLFYPNLAGLPVAPGILRSWLPTWPF